MDLSAATSEVEGYLLLTVKGDVDLYTAPRLREILIEAHQAGHARIVVDLTRVAFIDSTGLGLLVGSLKRARASGGDVRIVADTDDVLRAFRFTGLDQLFVIRASVCEAVRS